MGDRIMDNFLDRIVYYAQEYGLKIVGALVILVVGWWIAKFAKNIIRRILKRKNVDNTMVGFICSLSYVAIMTFVIVAAMDKLDIYPATFVAVLAAAGFAIGMAMQGSLGNFAAGFLLIVFKPFKEGDYIEAGGTAGIVEDIQIFTTTLVTPDNKKVIVPNGKIAGDNIINYTAKGTRRLEWVVGTGYQDDIDKVKNVLQNIIDNDQRILKEPASMVAVKEMADSSVNFVARAWANSADYWDLYFDVTETIKKKFDSEGISIPFPQRDVHLYEHKSQ